MTKPTYEELEAENKRLQKDVAQLKDTNEHLRKLYHEELSDRKHWQHLGRESAQKIEGLQNQNQFLDRNRKFWQRQFLYMESNRNEARYWARHYKRLYLASILLTGNVIEQTRNGRYRIAKKADHE